LHVTVVLQQTRSSIGNRIQYNLFCNSVVFGGGAR
jgi:hypothetical protein